MSAAADTDETNLPDPLVDRARRLFSFLGQAQQLKSPSVNDLETYRRDGAVHWLHDVPAHASVQLAAGRGTPELSDPVVTVDRIARVDPPMPEAELASWLDGPIDDPHKEPTLLKERYLPPPSDEPDIDGDEQLRRISSDDLPAVDDAFRRFQQEWRAWAAQDLRDEPARTFYGSLFSTYVSANGHPDELELVLGSGLLGWRPDAHPTVRRHLLVTPVKVLFDDATGRLTVSVDETADGTRVELDMLNPSMIGDPQRVNAVRNDARSADAHPLDRDHAGELARRLVHVLSSESEYRHEDAPVAPAPRPVASFAPALILRKRSQQGIVEIFRQIVGQIEATGSVPDGIRPLVDPEHTPAVMAASSGERRDGALVTADDEVFLPLPVNDVQLRILRQVDANAQTLIQGPPGTGKTHTAAVLISHLLAQGKRVLVTAQTDRALKEVRDKLPAPIRPLAVSVVGASREDMSDLRVAVERIAAAAGEHDEDDVTRRITQHVDAVDMLRRRRAEARHRLLEAREREVRVHNLPGYSGTLAEIARRRDLQRPVHGWISQFAIGSDEPPLSGEAVMAWRNQLLDHDLIADEPAAAHRLVDPATIAEPRLLADLAAEEKRAAADAAQFDNLRRHPAYAGVQRLPGRDRQALGERLHELATHLHGLLRRREPWVREALDDVCHDRHQVWVSRRDTVANLVDQAGPLVAALGPAADIHVDGDAGNLVPTAQALLQHLESGGRIKLDSYGSPRVGPLTARAIKNAAVLFERARVDGAVPTTPDHVRALLTWIDGTRLLGALDRAWPAGTVIPPEDTLHERLQWHVTELQLLDRVLTLGAELQQEDRQLGAAGLPRPTWMNPQGLDAYVALPRAAGIADALAEATRPLDELARCIADAERWPDSDPVLTRLADAVRRRDHAAYAAAHERLVRLHQVRVEVHRRADTARRLGAASPALAAAVAADPAAEVWEERLPAFVDAWAWAAAGQWIAARSVVDVNALQGELNHIDDDIRKHVQELAAVRAWGHAVAPTRLSRGSRASLEQYAALVRRFGKGTGQYREQRRAEIRNAMDRCRPAVPVWIMPLYRIADQLRIEPDMFDVVIVDEASQAGLEATFLQYLAPRIVVIGDDKQVSPSAVGVNEQQLRDLGNQYLYDDDFRATWQDPRSSLFDAAKIWFAGMLTLVEHRRCVPEIIGFSNRIAYEPDGVRLIPVRQFGADRLEPIRTVFVREGHERGASANRTNPAEVDAIVDQIEKCLTDPAYDGLTFGVISLLGTGQAKAIEKKLLDRVSPDEWTARDLRCGDAADFQGSERDVMFLSMVAAPAPDRRLTALTASTYVQRYNVAASRAKDQMWLFHSVDPAALTNKDDMRFQLLDYCYGVQNRAVAADDGALPGVVPEDTLVSPFDSLFEQRVCNRLIDRGYSVTPQFPALGYVIDLVVVGAKTRLAVECDGDHWHGPDVYQRDMGRQRELERCGWHFVRVLESDFYLDPAKALAPVWERLAELEIHPSGWTVSPDAESADEASEQPDNGDGDVINESIALVDPELGSDDAWFEDDSATRHDTSVVHVDETPNAEPVETTPTAGPVWGNALAPYEGYRGSAPSLAVSTRGEIIDSLVAIVAVEGPLLGHRLHSVYIKAAAGQRVSQQAAKVLNSAVSAAVRQGRLVQQDPLGESGVKPRTFRLPDQPAIRLRTLGTRTFDQIPPAELAEVMRQAAQVTGWEDIDTVFRETMARFGVRRMGSTVRARLEAVAPLARTAGHFAAND